MAVCSYDATSIRELTCNAYGITQCCLPSGRGDISAFAPAKLVLDLAPPEGCAAELD